VTAFNVWGANGLLSRRTGTTSVYDTFDPQGSVVQRLDANENILSASAYDAWGNLLVPNPNDPFGYEAQWGYYTDNETSLLPLTHRYYDPGQGRIVTRDPVGYSGGVNLHGYVGNGVERGIDPSGKIVKFCWRPVTWALPEENYGHWFVFTSKCGCIGYDPHQGIIMGSVAPNNIGGCRANLGGYGIGYLHCSILTITPQQEQCLCEEGGIAKNGGSIDGQKWWPGYGLSPSGPRYNLWGHSCEDFTTAIIGGCNINSNLPIPDRWLIPFPLLAE